MTAQHVLGQQWEQLPMFATPHEIVATHNFTDRGGAESMERLQRRKNAESEKSGLAKSIRDEGVHTPVEIFTARMPYKNSVRDGHHRVFSALQSRPHDLLPLKHGQRL